MFFVKSQDHRALWEMTSKTIRYFERREKELEGNGTKVIHTVIVEPPEVRGGTFNQIAQYNSKQDCLFAIAYVSAVATNSYDQRRIPVLAEMPSQDEMDDMKRRWNSNAVAIDRIEMEMQEQFSEIRAMLFQCGERMED